MPKEAQVFFYFLNDNNPPCMENHFVTWQILAKCWSTYIFSSFVLDKHTEHISSSGCGKMFSHIAHTMCDFCCDVDIYSCNFNSHYWANNIETNNISCFINAKKPKKPLCLFRIRKIHKYFAYCLKKKMCKYLSHC